jgi:hypothetical protein
VDLAIARQCHAKKKSVPGKGYAYNNGRTVGSGVFYEVCARQYSENVEVNEISNERVVRSWQQC